MRARETPRARSSGARPACGKTYERCCTACPAIQHFRCSPIFARVEMKQSSVHENSAACNGYCQLQKTNSRTSANSSWGHSITGIRRPRPRVISIKHCRKKHWASVAASGVTTRPTHCEAEQGGAWPVEGDPVAAAGCCPQDGLRLARLAPEARAAGRCHRPCRRHCRWPSARRAYRSESSALSPGSGPRPCRPGGTSVAGGGVLVCLRSLPLPFLPASPKCIRAAARRRRGRA